MYDLINTSDMKKMAWNEKKHCKQESGDDLWIIWYF